MAKTGRKGRAASLAWLDPRGILEKRAPRAILGRLVQLASVVNLVQQALLAKPDLQAPPGGMALLARAGPLVLLGSVAPTVLPAVMVRLAHPVSAAPKANAVRRVSPDGTARMERLGRKG
jgi:hypothetical protein